MSNSKNVPKYSLHTAIGQARVTVDGKHHYLGKFGSPEIWTQYAKLIGQHFHEESGLANPFLLGRCNRIRWAVRR